MRYQQIKLCRICGNNQLQPIFDFGELSSCGYFLSATPGDRVPSAPVALIRCPDCGLVQLAHDYDQDNLFRNTYGYRSGLNSSMVNHLQNLVQIIQDKTSLCSGDTVLDIGSNDATLLKSYSIKGLNRIGIDPSIEQFIEFYPEDIQSSADYFNAATFRKIVPKSLAKVVTSISMFYDLPNPNAFVDDIASILDPKGIWVFEQSYLPLMLQQNSFDTICHEHLEYYALKQIVYLLKSHGLRVFDVEFNDVNGGSFRVYACHENGPFQSESTKITNVLAEEKAMGLDTIEIYRSFFHRIEELKTKVLNFLSKCKQEGATVHGYGASTKGNTLLQFFGINQNLLPAIAECNPTKWGCYTPGTKIPIISEEQSKLQSPDYYFVLPWHFKKNFLIRERFFLEKGGRFVFPLPEFELVSA